MVLRLPPELIDEIIAWIDLPSTLCSCCLVCHSWLPASRNRLLEIVYIPDAVAYDLFLTRVVRGEDMDTWLPSVRTLVVGDDNCPNPRAHNLFYDLAGLLPNLHGLYIDSLDWTTYPVSPKAPLALSRFENVRELGVFNVVFPSFGFFRRLISLLPSLARLVLSGFTWPRPPEIPFYHVPSHRKIIPRLKSILILFELHGDTDLTACLYTLLLWLSQSPFRLSLRSVSVPEGMLDEASSLLWRTIARSFTALEIYSPRRTFLQFC